MPAEPEQGRRHFLGRAAMVLAATRFGLRTLPYVRAWDQHHRQGSVVIGVHTPRVRFRTEARERVPRGASGMKLDFADPRSATTYAIWRAFNNRYWPALYFIDARGRVREYHFGEGEEERSDKVIRRLQAETGVTGDDKAVVPIVASGFELQADWRNVKSPEVYLGLRTNRALLFARRCRVGAPSCLRHACRGFLGNFKRHGALVDKLVVCVHQFNQHFVWTGPQAPPDERAATGGPPSCQGASSTVT